MQRTSFVALFLLLSGCLSGGWGTAPHSPTAGPPDAAWAADRGINETELAEQHFQTLRASGSFTLNRSSTYAIDGDPRPPAPRPDWYAPPSRTLAAVDLTAGRLHHRHWSTGQSQGATFISPEVDATRRRPCTDADCQWEYSYLERASGDTVAGEIDHYRRDRAVRMLRQVMDDWNYTYDGTVHRNGHRLYRYRAEWVFDRPVHPFAEPPTGTGSVLVSGDGVVRRWAYAFTGPVEITQNGSTRTVTLTQRHVVAYRQVGETTVTRPDWVSDAATNTTHPTTVTGSA